VPRVLRFIPAAWALLLAVLLLGPALAPGLVLSYDMVWVPDLALRPDSFGLGSGLPRAVPSDAVVAVLDELVPGALLQKLVLIGSLVAAGAGVARLVEGLPLLARLTAVSFAVWNPFVVERLLIGHWPVLLGCAVLPWILVVGASDSRAGRAPWRLGPLVVVGSLSASTGVATAVATLVSGRRVDLGPRCVLLLAANAPWLVSGLLHSADATSDPRAAHVFATSREGLLPAPLAALGLGGIWNGEVVPGSRTGWLGVLFLVLLTVLLLAGARSGWRTTEPLLRRAVVACWAVGVTVALVSGLFPGLLAVAAEHVPGGGLLRDGSRLLALAAPLTAVVAGHGAAALARRAPDRVTGAVLGVSLSILPVTVMPDAAWGAQGRLQAVHLPSAYVSLADAVREHVHHGDVVVLPLSTYRAPGWNGGRKVLDPLPRLVPRDVIASDTLHVSGRTIAGEDPRARSVAVVLSDTAPEERAGALARLGVGAVVTDSLAGQDLPAIPGADVVLDDGGLRILLLADVEERGTPTSWVVWVVLAWLTWLMPLGAAIRWRKSWQLLRSVMR